MLLDQIKTMAEAMEQELIEMRRHIHRVPELAFHEEKTAEYICKKLDEYGIEYRSGIAPTGVLGMIRGKGEGKTVLLRADMDGLPVEEKNTDDFISTRQGYMHACGHDAHVACLLGAGKVLKQLSDQWSGCVKLMFQPAEEGAGGAQPMIEQGILENPKVDAAFALHVDSLSPAGSISVTDGPVMAAPDEFEIIIKGRGGHGAYPQNTIDPILTAAKVVEGLQSIVSRTVSPMTPALISVCSINSGTFYNVIPETAKLRGTARTFDNDLRDRLPMLIERVAKGISQAMGADAEVTYRFMYPPVINNSEMFTLVKEVGQKLLGDEHVTEVKEGSMGGEDFSYVANLVPSMYFKLGTGNEEKGICEPLHSPTFRIDEKALPVGVVMMAASAVEYLLN